MRLPDGHIGYFMSPIDIPETRVVELQTCRRVAAAIAAASCS